MHQTELNHLKMSFRETEKMSQTQKNQCEKLQLKYDQESARLKDVLFQFDELQREYQINQKELLQLK